MRISAILVALVVATPVFAKPIPVVELRVRSIDDFLKLSDYVADLAGQPDMGKSVVALANAFTQPKTGLQGLDRTRPIGAYAITTAAGQPAFAVLVPIQDKDRFLALLKDRLQCKIEESETGSMITAPNVPVPLYLAFHADYAYITALSADWIADENRVEPKAFFATKLAANSMMGLVVHMDKVANDFKTAAIAQAELKTADDAKQGAQPGETQGETAIRLFTMKKTVSAFAAIVKQGQTITADVTIEPKTDLIGVTAKVVPLPKTSMAAYVQSLGDRKGHTLSTTDSDAVAGRLNFALPESMRDEWAKVADQLLDDMANDPKEDAEGRKISKVFIKGIRPTFESGVFDGAVSVSGGEERTIDGIIGLVEGREAEAAARGMLAFLPAEEGTAKFDVAEAGPARLHAIKLAKPAKPFGDAVWLGTAPDRLAFSSRGLSDVKTISTRETAAGPIAQIRLRATQVEQLDKARKADATQAAIKKVFGDEAVGNRDEIALRITGGEALELGMTMKGKALAFFAALDKAKKGE